uniref:Uncharacterized protein n=1 Tax=Romanomermis culicivorax TaxID=13658 RepID=A0A915JVJ8_ROMCU
MAVSNLLTVHETDDYSFLVVWITATYTTTDVLTGSFAGYTASATGSRFFLQIAAVHVGGRLPATDLPGGSYLFSGFNFTIFESTSSVSAMLFSKKRRLEIFNFIFIDRMTGCLLHQVQMNLRWCATRLTVPVDNFGEIVLFADSLSGYDEFVHNFATAAFMVDAEFGVDVADGVAGATVQLERTGVATGVAFIHEIVGSALRISTKTRCRKKSRLVAFRAVINAKALWLYGTLLRREVPRGAALSIHTNKRYHAAPRSALSYFTARYRAAPYGTAYLLLDFALVKKCVMLVSTNFARVRGKLKPTTIPTVLIEPLQCTPPRPDSMQKMLLHNMRINASMETLFSLSSFCGNNEPAKVIKMLNGHVYNEDFQDCLDILQPQDIDEDKNYNILANGDSFCDLGDQKNNTPYVQKLLQDIENHRIKEKQLQDKLDEMKKLGDVYIKNIIDGDRQFSSDLLDLESSSNHDNYDETNEPLSSRSDKSIVSLANSTTLQAALDVFAENNKLLIDKESSEQQIIRLNKELQESNSKNLAQEIQNKSLLDENLNLKLEIDRLFKRMSPQFDNDQDENLILHVKDLETDLECKERRLEIVIKEKIALQQEFAALNNKFNDIRAEKIGLSDQVKDLLNQKASFQSKIDQLKISNQSKEQESDLLENLRNENIDLKEKSKVQTIKFRELNNEFEDLRTKFRIKVEEVEHLKSMVSEKLKQNFSAEYESAKRQCSKLEQDCRKLIEENNDFRSQLKSAEELKRALDSQTLGVENLKQVLQSKNVDIKQIQSRISQLERKNDEQQEEKQDLWKNIRTLEERLEEKCREIVNLQKEFEQYQANAEMQFQDTCSTYEARIVEKEQKVSDLETLLRKHIEYPGKFDSILSTSSSTIQNKVLLCDKYSSTSDLLQCRDIESQFDGEFVPGAKNIVLHLFDLLRNLVENGIDNLAEIKGTIANFMFSEADFREICDDLVSMI